MSTRDPRSGSSHFPVHTTARVALLGLLASCGTVWADEPTAGPAAGADVARDDAEASNLFITRLAGDADAPVVVKDPTPRLSYRAGTAIIDSPLPEGYPRPTAPGVVELKFYPSVRRAEFGGERGAGERGFWPLFRHISDRDIAMTAPVEMDMRPDGGSTMSFLYRTRELGPTGSVENSVEVRDTDPVWAVTVGMQGARNGRGMAEARAKLDEVIAGLDGWAATGEVRWMGYNGPSVARDRQWWELQFIVERVRTNGSGAADTESAVSPDSPAHLGG